MLVADANPFGHTLALRCGRTIEGAVATTEIERASRESIARVLAGRENAPSSAAARIDLERRIAAYEARFGIESDHLAAAIDRGDLDESLDICNWLMDLALLRRVAPA